MGSNEHDYGGYGIAARSVNAQLALQVFEQGTQIGHTIPHLNGDLSGLRDPPAPVLPTKPFTLLPEELFTPEAEWKAVDRNRWRYADHITLWESRAVVRLLDIVTSSAAFHRTMLMILEDNRPTACAMTKGRSPAPHSIIFVDGGRRV